MRTESFSVVTIIARSRRDTTVDEADQFRFGVVMMIDVALRQIDVRAEFGKGALKLSGAAIAHSEPMNASRKASSGN